MIDGETAPGFEPVRRVFESNFEAEGEVGAGFCAYVGGQRVVDLWGGEARPGLPWGPDTPVVVFSTTKGATAAVIALLVESGEIDPSLPVADYWAQFAAGGKADIRVDQILTHTSGVVTFPGYVDVILDPGWWGDLDRIADSFAPVEPEWEPGARHGYHGASFGLLLNEVVRRATGRTIGTVLAEEFTDRLGLDFWIGTPPGAHDRVAHLIDASPATDPALEAYLSLFTPEHLQGRAHLIGPDGITAVAGPFNTEAAWQAEFPSGGGVASARGIAGLYDALSRGGAGLLKRATIDLMTRERVRGPDHVLLIETAFGLGFMRPTPYISMGPSAAAFGHGGLGGSGGFADPASGVAAGYAMNQLKLPGPGVTTRMTLLVDALYACLG